MQAAKNVLNKLTPGKGEEGAAAPTAAAQGPNACAPCAATAATSGTVVQQTTTTTTAAVPVAAQQPAATQAGAAAVCGQEFFTKVEDRPLVKERVEMIREHRPVEKEFVVETRATGVEREVKEGITVEHLGTTERIVAVTPPKPPCA